MVYSLFPFPSSTTYQTLSPSSFHLPPPAIPIKSLGQLSLSISLSLSLPSHRVGLQQQQSGSRVLPTFSPNHLGLHKEVLIRFESRLRRFRRQLCRNIRDCLQKERHDLLPKLQNRLSSQNSSGDPLIHMEKRIQHRHARRCQLMGRLRLKMIQLRTNPC